MKAFSGDADTDEGMQSSTKKQKKHRRFLHGKVYGKVVRMDNRKSDVIGLGLV